jgi:hypothetical protein
MIQTNLDRIFRRIGSINFIKSIRVKWELVNWKNIYKHFEAHNSLESQGTLPKILIVTSIGENINSFALDSVLAKALESRGCEVYVLLCDGVLDACMNCEIRKFKSLNEFHSYGSKKLCESCISTGIQFGRAANLKILKYGDFLANDFHLKSSHEESALAGALRFLAIGDKASPEVNLVLSKFQESSEVSEKVISACILKMEIDVVIAHHGIYVPQGLAVKAAKSLGKSIVTWSQSYRKGTYLFSHHDSAHKTLSLEDFDSSPLTPSQETTLMKYLVSRDAGTNDWIRFGIARNLNSDIELPVKEMPTALLLTNVNWDAQVHFDDGFFVNMEEWLVETIRWFQSHPEVQLIVRVHPAEITGTVPTRDPMSNVIKREFPNLAPNIFVVDADSDISTYSLFPLSDLGIIFGTKTGIELTASGIPTIVAGEAWIKNKGISIDPKSKKEYFELLEKFAAGIELPDINKSKAMSYAYHYFFKRMIPVTSILPIPYYPYARPNLNSNWESSDPGLVQIVNGIISGTPFVFEN